MTRKAKMMVSVLAFALVGGAAFAQDAATAPAKPHRAMPEFSVLDANKDGKITPEELSAYHEARKAERIKAFDTNGDGMITLDEAKAAFADKAPEDKRAKVEAKVEERFKKIDTEGKGQVSVEDFFAPKGKGKGGDKAKHFFEKLDADKDGALSAEEYANAAKMHGKGGKHGKGHHGKHDSAPQAAPEAKPAQ